MDALQHLGEDRRDEVADEAAEVERHVEELDGRRAERARIELNFAAGLLLLICLFEVFLWTFLFNAIYNRDVFYLGSRVAFAILSAGFFGFAVFWFERQILTFDDQSKDRTSKLRWAMVVRLLYILGAAYVTSKPFELMLYPRTRHAVTDPALVRHLRGEPVEAVAPERLGLHRVLPRLLAFLSATLLIVGSVIGVLAGMLRVLEATETEAGPDGVVTLYLDRPDQLNAFNVTMARRRSETRHLSPSCWKCLSSIWIGRPRWISNWE